MNKTIRAIYQGGVFHPLEEVDLKDKPEVLVTVESSQADEEGAVASKDPIAGITFSSGLGDLSQRFDDYRRIDKQAEIGLFVKTHLAICEPSVAGNRRLDKILNVKLPEANTLTARYPSTEEY